MVKRIISILNKKIGGLHEAAYLLATFSLLSHLLALIRDRLLAHSFGAGTILDTYYAAFRVPDFIFVSVGSIVSLFVLIPFLVEHMKDDNSSPSQFISGVFSSFFIFIVLVSAAVYFFIPSISSYLFPGFTDAATKESLITLTRIMLLSPILLGISNILASITQVTQRFFVYAVSPVLYNFGIILGILFLYPIFGIKGLAYGVVFGAVLHVLIQIPIVLRSGIIPRFTFLINIKEVWCVVRTSFPRTVALATNQAVLLFLVALASLMAEGSISIFNFGFNIQGVPLSIIGVSYSVAAFPTLAHLFSGGDMKKFMEHMLLAIKHVIFWSIPAAVMFIVLRAQIVRVALGSGEFSWDDTRLTAAVLALFVISITAQSLELLFIRGYYAQGKTRKPLIVKLVSSALIVLMAYVGVAMFKNIPMVQFFMESLLRVSGVPGSIVIILALSYSIGMFASAGTFWGIFRHDFGHHLPRSLYRTLFQSFSSSVVAGAITYVFLVLFGSIFDINTFWGIFLQGFLAGIMGIISGILTLLALKNEEIREIWGSLHTKFWKSKAVLPEAEEL